MKEKINSPNILYKRCLFYIIFISGIIEINLYNYFNTFKLLSGNIILVTEEGLKYLNLESNNITSIEDFTVNEEDLKYISLIQLPLEEEGYILCKIQNYLYVINKEANKIIEKKNIDEILKKYVNLVLYKSKNNILYCFLNFINNEQKIKIISYQIDLGSNIILKEDFQIIENEDNIEILSNNRAISCEIMYSSNYTENELLICFTQDYNQKMLTATAFDPEKNLTYKYRTICEEQSKDITFIKSIVTQNKIISFVCYIKGTWGIQCILYDSKDNLWSNSIKLTSTILGDQSFINLGYLNDKKEYYLIFYYIYNTIYFFRFDEKFDLKYSNNEGKCFYNYEITQCNDSQNEYYSSLSLIEDKLFIYIKCFDDKDLQIIKLKDECNTNFEYSEFNIDKTSLLYSTLLSLSSNLSSSISSSILNPSSYLSSSSFFSTSFPSLLNFISSSSLLNSYSSILKSHMPLLPFSSNLESPSEKKSKNIEFYVENDRNIAKSNKTKEEIKNDLLNIIEEIEIGKIYEIKGNDYNISIIPLKEANKIQSTFIELSICEEILKRQYNLPSKEILTILQVGIDKKNDKALTNQVEYEIFNEKKEKLDLSYCKNVPIKVNYEIKDKSLINQSMVAYYSDLGIDIFDSKDSFFNDICYPFTNSISDIILKDRILDIYQNYSLCDNNCEYELINITDMIVTCSCQIKTEMNFEVTKPVFSEIILETFENSNFGVMKCYNLVFRLKNKFSNIGFLLFLILIIFHIPLFIYYIIYGIKPIIIFINEEMKKYNYTIKVLASPTIKKINSNSPNKERNKSTKNLISKFNRSIYKLEQNKDNKLLSLKTNHTEFNQDKLKIINIKNHNNNNNNSIFSSMRSLKKVNKSLFIKKNLKINRNKQNNFRKNKMINLYIKNTNLKENNWTCPGYYNLIQMDSNNSINHIPPKSKYILDNYDYENAIKYDKRDFWRIYYICLLSKSNILNTFFFKSRIEIQSLRITLFIFNYSCDFSLNALFYLNQKISDKYHYKGDYLYWFTLINNITISIFSTIFGFALVLCLGLLTNSKEDIEILFKREEEKMRNNKKYKVNNKTKKMIYIKLMNIFKILKIKIIYYICIEFLIMLLFFYYITAFCEVYKYTQVSWILDSVVSLFLSIITEFITSFFNSIIYIISIQYKIKPLYKFAIFFYGLG